ncbi:sunset domain-containing protein [Kutzneria viridogrisea]
MWLFGQVWLLCLLAFVIGAVLDSVLFTRPQRNRVRELERQLAEAQREPVALASAPEVPAERTSLVVEEPVREPERVPSWERQERTEPEPEQRPVAAVPSWEREEPEEQEEPVTRLLPQQQEQPEPPGIPNPSPAEMGLASRLAGEPVAAAAETTSILPPVAREDIDPADMELADHEGQLAYAPADEWDEDRYLVDDVVDDLSEEDRAAAAETTGPVSADLVRRAEEAVAARAAAAAEDEPSWTGELPVIVDEPDSDGAEEQPGAAEEPEPVAGYLEQVADPEHAEVEPDDALDGEHSFTESAQDEERRQAGRESAEDHEEPHDADRESATEGYAESEPVTGYMERISEPEDVDRGYARSAAEEQDYSGHRQDESEPVTGYMDRIAEPEDADRGYARSAAEEQDRADRESATEGYAESEPVTGYMERIAEPEDADRDYAESAHAEPEPESTNRHAVAQDDEDHAEPEAAARHAESAAEELAPAARHAEPESQSSGFVEPEPQQPEHRSEAVTHSAPIPVPVRPEHFGRPIPPGPAAEAVQPQPEPVAIADAAPPQPPTRPAAAAAERPRSLFEPVIDPDYDGSYDDGPHGLPPLQEPIQPRQQASSEPFVPTLAPGLLDGTAPKPPMPTGPAGLPKRTVGSEAWPRMDTGSRSPLPQDAPQPFTPQPFTPQPAPFRPRAQFSPLPRTGDKAPIRRPSGGGPRTPFGPGSALPKPDGSAPSPEYVVKASVAARRFYTSDTEGYSSTRAEVWFRSVGDATRAGFTAHGRS